MNDRELCELFGTTLEDVEREISDIGAGDFSAHNFSKAIGGRPMEPEGMDTISL